jgi:hypothetical protein
MKKLIIGGLAALAIGLVGCGTTVAAPAVTADEKLDHNQRLICSALDDDPTQGGVTDFYFNALAEGVPEGELTATLATAPRDVCPEHAGLVREWMHNRMVERS